MVCRPENIPHLSSQQSQGSAAQPSSGSATGGPALTPTTSLGQAGSPVKEPSVLQRGMSVDEQEGGEVATALEKAAEAKGVPIRQ